LIAKKAEGHHADLAGTLNSVHWRTRRRDSQNQSDQRCAEQADPRLGRHSEPRFVITASFLYDFKSGEKPADPPAGQSTKLS
jgi:hypothetical protein